MRRLSTTALLAVPALLFATLGTVNANPPMTANFGCAGHCFKMFPHIHQHGPLFNYGPYYGYYPFKPYGPWDAYLRYDPFFYGDPYANWSAQGQGGNYYRNLFDGGLGGKFGGKFGGHGHGLGLKGGSCGGGFLHASWLQGGWFRGHTWLGGGFGHGHGHKHGCSSCGGVAVAPRVEPTGDAVARYTGIGSPEQSAVFYAATPTLDPSLDVIATSYTK
jgi:hypothetical protein